MSHFIRKRDGRRYASDLKPVLRPGFNRWGPCCLLRPLWEGGTHYKTVAAFEREFELAKEAP
jgi:hypothetical protein